MWKWFWFLVALAFIDGVQTILLLSELDLRSEANPLMRSLIQQFGFAGMWGIKVTTLAIVASTMHRFSKSVMPVISAIMLCVVMVNFHHLQHTPTQERLRVINTSEAKAAHIYILDSFERYPDS